MRYSGHSTLRSKFSKLFLQGARMFELFIEWAWARHHNILSWYVRPLFILPYCYFAYKRKPGWLMLTLLLFPTSLFWFPAPDVVSETVLQYMNWERDFMLHGSLLQRGVLLFLVIAFLWLLALAFWKRNVYFGLLVLNAGTAMKVVWSIFFGGAVGYASILPSVITLAICNAVVYLIWRRGRASVN